MVMFCIIVLLNMQNIKSIPFNLYVQTLSKIFRHILEIHSLCIYVNWYICICYPNNQFYR